MSPDGPLEITGQLDAGSHEGRLQEVALEFMEYMCFAYKVLIHRYVDSRHFSQISLRGSVKLPCIC